MAAGKEMFGVCVMVLVVILGAEKGGVHSYAITKTSDGGCIAEGTIIPFVSAQGLNEDLYSRINDIRKGGDQSREVFQNREGCLPPNLSYLEFRLYPNKADANRIVWQKNSEVFYFTKDHYISFYQVF